MKKWSIILAVALVATWLMVPEFFANETILYFSSEPHRLLYVAAIAVMGGFVALAFDRLSRQAQARVQLFAWGTAASILTAFVGYMGFRLASFSALVVESGAGGWVVLILFLFSAGAAYLWFEFCRAWKTRVSQ